MSDIKSIIEQLKKLDTERVNPDTVDIDRLSPIEIIKKINDQDRTVARVVAKASEPIAKTAEIYADCLKKGNRVFLIGAGTSGRLGVLDAAECPPTFGSEPDQIIGLIAGGYETMIMSKEGVEDNREAAVDDLKAKQLNSGDLVIGIAASCRTPYTLAGLAYAISLGCHTAFIVCNKGESIGITPEILIELPVGPEVITGSTRMKSGTAQKMALNMISTTAMILLGKTYGNLMIDLKARSKKLAARSRKILVELLDITFEKADKLLNESDGSVKIAIVMSRLDCSYDEALIKIKNVDGFLSKLI